MAKCRCVTCTYNASKRIEWIGGASGLNCKSTKKLLTVIMANNGDKDDLFCAGGEHRRRFWGVARARAPNNWETPMHLSLFTTLCLQYFDLPTQYLWQVYASGGECTHDNALITRPMVTLWQPDLALTWTTLGQPLWFDASLVIKVVHCFWISSGTKNWRLWLRIAKSRNFSSRFRLLWWIKF